MRSESPITLLYHGLAAGESDRDPAGVSVTRGMFERQLRWLAVHGWQALDLDGYLTRRFGSRSGRRSVLLTFDDGFQSTVEFGLPIMQELGFPGLLFVPAGMVGKTAEWWDVAPDAPLVDADQLRALADAGMEVGAHGMEHVFMPGLSDAELRRNTQDARDVLADLVGKAPRAFAYPQGRFDVRVAAAVERAGYRVAFSVTLEGGRFGLARREVVPTDDLRKFRLKLSPAYEALRAWRHRKFRQEVGRVSRDTTDSRLESGDQHPEAVEKEVGHTERPERRD
jgi:peptidoglycan/xylan/chitin deacetylase (PgdA/CDA1 family)